MGDEPVKDVTTKSYQTGELQLISVTDCVKDRLAGYYHWKDRQCLEQAIMVSQRNSVDQDEVERWSRSEGMSDSFETIKDDLFPKFRG